MEQILTIVGVADAQISLVPEATKYRDKLVAEAAAITSITDAVDADAANNLLREIHNQLKAVEGARKEIKKPVDELAARIQDTAKNFSGPLEVEKARISSILGAYQRAEAEKAEAARRAAIAEQQRIAAEEAAKVAKTEAAHGSDSPEARAAHDAAVDKLATASSAVAVAEPVKLAGTAIRKTWKFEVTDIAALMAYNKDLVTIAPNTAAINAVIKNNQSVPGLRIWEETKATVR